MLDLTNALPMWTVYDHPTDYPDSFVARKYLITGGEVAFATNEVVTAPSITAIRKAVQDVMPYVLTCLPRDDSDDSKIVECWL